MSRILVVDDEQDLCEILRFNLEAEGFGVEVAYSGEEAWLKWKAGAEGGREPFDLLLLDVMMERMSGFELAARLRGAGCAAPLIFLTASDDYQQGFGVGADDYIQKPFSFDNVLLRVRAVLRRAAPEAAGAPDAEPSGLARRAAAQAAAQAPALRLDPASGEATLDGRALELTRREFDILQLLWNHRGHYFSRTGIMEAVWPDDTCVGDRSIDVHIARLRKKLGPALPINNKTGIGYGIV